MSRYKKNDRKREMFDAVCSDCGKDCKVPFKPTSGKPIYCSECFEKYDKKKDNRSSKRSYEKKSNIDRELLEKIDKKLDYVIETLKYGRGKY